MTLTYIDIVNHNYALLCRYCNKRVLDPDKKPNQQYINTKCFECGKDPEEEKMLRKALKKANKKHKHHKHSKIVAV